MSFITRAAAIAAVSMLQVGCNAADQPTAPASLVGSEASASRFAGGATVGFFFRDKLLASYTPTDKAGAPTPPDL